MTRFIISVLTAKRISPFRSQIVVEGLVGKKLKFCCVTLFVQSLEVFWARFVESIKVSNIRLEIISKVCIIWTIDWAKITSSIDTINFYDVIFDQAIVYIRQRFSHIEMKRFFFVRVLKLSFSRSRVFWNSFESIEHFESAAWWEFCRIINIDMTKISRAWRSL